MKKILLGLIFIFFDFRLFLGILTVNLLPDFVGYIIIYLGIKEMIKYSKKFREAIPSTIAGICLTSFFTLLNFFVINPSDSIFYSSGLVSMMLIIYISYKIILVIREIEINGNRKYNTKFLTNCWKAFTIVTLVSCLSIVFPAFYIVMSIASIIVIILYLISFHRTIKLYNSYR